MNIEDALKNCEINLKQIKQYEPDPFYINYFFNKYMNSVNDVYNGIFEEANRDFGLFISEISQEKFNEKSREKQDQNAMKFSEWYTMKFDQQHQNTYPNFMKKIYQFKNKLQKLPETKIMIRAIQRCKDDPNQQIIVNLSSNNKLRSKEELNIEIKRQLPIFLEIINHKRDKKNEPKIDESQVTASTFLDIEEYNDMEIAYAAEIYISVMKRLVEESRVKIKELTTWN